MKIIDIDEYKRNRVGGNIMSSENSIRNFIKAIVYYANNTSAKLYKTKLHKMLFYTQFLYYKRYNEPFLNTRFIKNYYGPVAENIDELLDEAVNLGVIKKKNTDYGMYIQPNKKIPEEDYGKELNIIREVAEKFGKYTSKEISDYSHNESLWLQTDLKQEISLSRAEELNEF